MVRARVRAAVLLLAAVSALASTSTSSAAISRRLLTTRAPWLLDAKGHLHGRTVTASRQLCSCKCSVPDTRASCNARCDCKISGDYCTCEECNSCASNGKKSSKKSSKKSFSRKSSSKFNSSSKNKKPVSEWIWILLCVGFLGGAWGLKKYRQSSGGSESESESDDDTDSPQVQVIPRSARLQDVPLPSAPGQVVQVVQCVPLTAVQPSTTVIAVQPSKTVIAVQPSTTVLIPAAN
jgi:hypothetical protein